MMRYSFLSRYYDDIPSEILSGRKTVLEFGPAVGISQLMSRHRTFFIENEENYLGVETYDYDKFHLPVIKGDIRTYVTDIKYDIVIAMHVLEHIEFHYWKETIGRIKSFLVPGGCLVIGLPYKEPEYRGYTNHKVFDITEETILEFLPDARVTKYKNKIQFAEDGASFIWALFRYIKRRVRCHPSVRRYDRILVIYKEREQ